MLKPSKTFKMSKQTKRFMATIVKAEDRNAFKRAMIDAQLQSEIVVKTRDRDTKRPQGNANYQMNDTGTASTQAEKNIGI